MKTQVSWPYNFVRNDSAAQGIYSTGRLDVRIDLELRRRFEEMARFREIPISEILPCLIDEAYEENLRERRSQAVERLTGLNVEDPPNPEVLSKELEEAHEPGGPN